MLALTSILDCGIPYEKGKNRKYVAVPKVCQKPESGKCKKVIRNE